MRLPIQSSGFFRLTVDIVPAKYGQGFIPAQSNLSTPLAGAEGKVVPTRFDPYKVGVLPPRFQIQNYPPSCAAQCFSALNWHECMKLCFVTRKPETVPERIMIF